MFTLLPIQKKDKHTGNFEDVPKLTIVNLSMALISDIEKTKDGKAIINYVNGDVYKVTHSFELLYHILYVRNLVAADFEPVADKNDKTFLAYTTQRKEEQKEYEKQKSINKNRLTQQ